MPFLTSVYATLETYVSRTLEVTFSTTSPLRIAADTAVLLVADGSGSEFGIRLERGHVIDVHLWDVGRRLRQRLPLHNVTISDATVTCTIPSAVLPRITTSARVSASLIVNGALVQSGYPVAVHYGRPNTDLFNSAPTKGLVKEGQNYG